MFQKAYEVYSLFWALRLNLISVAEMQKAGDKSDPDKPMTKEDLLSKLVDCCKE